MNAQILCEACDSAIESLHDYAPKYAIDLFPQVIHSERYDKLEAYYLTHYRTQLHQDTLTFFLTLIAYHEAILFIEKMANK